MTSLPTSRFPIEVDGETATIGSAAELAVTLDVLQGQHDRLVLEQLRPHLPAVIGNPLGLLATFRSLEPADQMYLVEALGTNLAELIGGAGRLRDLLAVLADATVEESLLRTLGRAGLRRLVLTAAELSEVLQWIYGSNDGLVLKLLGGEYVEGLLRSSRDLSLVLHSLDEATQTQLIEGLGWPKVRALSRNGHDLAQLLRALPGSLGVQLLSQYSGEQLVSLIGNERDWDYLCRRLEGDEAATLYRILGVRADA